MSIKVGTLLLRSPTLKMLSLSLALALALALAGAVSVHFNLTNIPEDFGTSIRYHWDAFHVLVKSGNPYDLAQHEELHRLTGWTLFEPMPYFYPPWTLILLGPILLPDFNIAVILLFVLDLMALGLTGVFAWRLVSKHPIPILSCFVCSICFFPAWMVISSGHINILAVCALSGALLALERKRDLLAGVALGFSLLKPHSIFLIFVAICYKIILERRWRVLLSLATTIGSASLLAFYFQPSIFYSWSERLESSSDWRTPTLATFVRDYLVQYSEGQASFPVWPFVAIPLLSLCGLLIWLGLTRAKIDWLSCFVPLAALSLICAPYGWVFDHTTLIIGQIFTLAIQPPHTKQFMRTLIASIVVQIGALGLNGVTSTQQGYIWFPLYFWLTSIIISRWGRQAPPI